MDNQNLEIRRIDNTMAKRKSTKGQTTVNLLQERVISEIFMFLWFVATIWQMPEYFVPVTKFMMTTVELAKCDKNIQ